MKRKTTAKRREVKRAELRALMREAAKAGCTEAIEHTHNFWHVSDGFKRYIEQEVDLRAQELTRTMRDVVSSALRNELARMKPARKDAKR